MTERSFQNLFLFVYLKDGNTSVVKRMLLKKQALRSVYDSEYSLTKSTNTILGED